MRPFLLCLQRQFQALTSRGVAYKKARESVPF